jgi:molecular chaperone IbpA|tara:strand:+ start:611 stop:1015 length:405 start_codon:yes stop_codon:yes gene_type:complete
MPNITWEQYTPYSIGFNETFQRLEALAGAGTNYPPYNVINGSDGRTILEVALAGFSREDLKVESERNVLTVSANKAPPDKERKYAHKGISYRTFARNWQMGDDVEVEAVEFKDGLLSIILRKELSEKQKRKKHF